MTTPRSSSPGSGDRVKSFNDFSLLFAMLLMIIGIRCIGDPDASGLSGWIVGSIGGGAISLACVLLYRGPKEKK